MITFRKIKFRNFLSVGNTFETVELNKHASVLIRGKNGQGKSLIIDAITFALFGKPFKKINKPQMVNSVNGKSLEVELTFDIGSKKYIVKRGIKPTIFEIWCDGVLVNQDAKTRDYQKFLEVSILKLNYKSFTQIVVLGSASFVPFMQLTANDRRIIIEDILDIKIFSAMKSIVRDNNTELKDNLASINYDVSLVKEKIKMQTEHIKNIKEDNQKKIDKLTEQENEITINMDDYEKINAKHEADIKSLVDIYDKMNHNIEIKKLEKLNNLKFAIEKNITIHTDQKEFYTDNDDCPACKQVITTLFKEDMIRKTTLTVVEMEEAIQKLTNKISISNSIIQDAVGKSKQISDINTHILQNRANINHLYQKRRDIQTEIANLKNTLGDGNESNLETLQNDENKLLDKKEVCLEDQNYTNIMLNILNDAGIKTRIIDQYLPIINKRVNAYLKDMDFFANFELDEQFNETIKSRHRDEFSYNSFSEGEKKRIDIALLLTWRDIASLKNSVNINILIMDEIFDSSLDELGVEDLMKLFSGLTNTNLFIISHRGDLLEDKFQNKLDVEKVKNFTVYKES